MDGVRVEYDNRDYYEALRERIDERIKRLKETQDSSRKKLNELLAQKKQTISTKMDISATRKGIENRKDSIADMTRLNALIYEIMYARFISVDLQTQEALKAVLPYLDSKEQSKYKGAVSTCLGNLNGNVKEGLEKKLDEATKIVKKLFGTSHIFIVHDGNFHQQYETTVQKALETLAKMKLREEPRLYLGTPSEEVIPEVEEFKSNLDLLLADKKFQGTKLFEKITKNKDKYIELMTEYIVAQKATFAMQHVIACVDGKVFGELIKFLQGQIASKRDVMRSATNAMNRIAAVEQIRSLIDSAREHEREERQKRELEERIKNRYEKLAYELEELRTKGGSLARIAQIEREMAEIRRDGDVDVFDSGMRGTEKFRTLRREETERIEEQEHEREKERLRREAERALGEAIELELESKARSNWKFKQVDKSSSEYKSVKSSLLYQASLSAEQRTLQAFQEGGRIRSDATLETLTPEERAIIDRNKEYFADNRYGYIAQYRQYVDSLDEGEEIRL